ncbi:MAG: aspartate-semialdehyde dehydrogenase [candidate division WOR-3 bacterium]|nr:aspartate-semialdehyde dehydrogenase [candidate division WOR-3 bacterium]
MTNIALIGATGLVGETFLSLLRERQFPYNNLLLIASPRSAGKTISVKDMDYTVKEFNENDFDNIDIAFFSAGSETDRVLVPLAAKKGTVCIDNSSAFRNMPEIPLIVPEVNFDVIEPENKIIANPNCSTIQLVLVLNAISQIYRLRSVVVSTYQAISGAGRSELVNYRKQSREGVGEDTVKLYDNLQLSIGSTDMNGYCEEELKLIKETKKIMRRKDMNVSATALRIPLSNVHTESVRIEIDSKADIEKIRSHLQKQGDLIKFNSRMDIEGINDSNTVFVSRLRKDQDNDNVFHIIISADNLRVGAALNGIKIAEGLLK